MIPFNHYHILLVEDETSLHETLRLNLELEGYEVSSAYDGPSALEAMQQAWHDLVVLDIMLPELDGFSVLEHMRLRKMEVPVLILSARSTATDRISGLRKGADDYLTKPFELEELLLRIKKLLQKSNTKAGAARSVHQFQFAGHTIDFKAQTAILADGRTVTLSNKEAMLLQLLTHHENEVVSREKILQSVWGYQVYPTTRTIDNFVLNFRKYFEEDSRNPKYFHSVRGVGYKFTRQPAQEDGGAADRASS